MGPETNPDPVRKDQQATSVVRIGGSLLDLPDLRRRLTSFLMTLGGRVLCIVGGGSEVDQLRARHQRGDLSTSDAHWAAIDVMGQNAIRLAPLLPGGFLADNLDMARSRLERNEKGVVFLDPSADLRRDAGRTLPIGWEVTSDSIAGWVADRMGADRLILLKSVGESGSLPLAEVARRGWVDDHFPVIAHALLERGGSISWVDLRSELPVSTMIQPDSNDRAG